MIGGVTSIGRRQKIIDVIHNKPVNDIPVGFWFHFLEPEFHDHGLEYRDLLAENREGHRRFIEEFDPDIVKIMTDGLFVRPYDTLPEINEPEDFYQVTPLSKSHPFFEESVQLAKDVRAMAGHDRFVIYNIFAPMFHWARLFTAGIDNNRKFYQLLTKDTEATKYALNVLTEDLEYLIRRVMTEADMDGIYLSVNNAERLIPARTYNSVVAPFEQRLLLVANEYSDNQMLHICGWRERQNILSCYQNYPAACINWAVHEEGLSLADGKKYFGGKTVLGGYDQMPGSLICNGSKTEIQEYARTLVREFEKTNGSTYGLIIGADCTVPSETPIEHLDNM